MVSKNQSQESDNSEFSLVFRLSKNQLAFVLSAMISFGSGWMFANLNNTQIQTSTQSQNVNRPLTTSEQLK